MRNIAFICLVGVILALGYLSTVGVSKQDASRLYFMGVEGYHDFLVNSGLSNEEIAEMMVVRTPAGTTITFRNMVFKSKVSNGVLVYTLSLTGDENKEVYKDFLADVLVAYRGKEVTERLFTSVDWVAEGESEEYKLLDGGVSVSVTRENSTLTTELKMK